MTGLGMPRKVLRKAHELGVHADCIAADEQGACHDCWITIMDIFEFFYGHAGSKAEVMGLIIDDMIADAEADDA